METGLRGEGIKIALQGDSCRAIQRFSFQAIPCGMIRLFLIVLLVLVFLQSHHGIRKPDGFLQVIHPAISVPVKQLIKKTHPCIPPVSSILFIVNVGAIDYVPIFYQKAGANTIGRTGEDSSSLGFTI